MKILAVDVTTERQRRLAERIEALGDADLELLDVSVNLSGVETFEERMSDCDVLLFGAGAANKIGGLVRRAKEASPDVYILLVVADQDYERGAFRLTHGRQVRKVLRENGEIFDLLQELVAIDGELRASGRVRAGRAVLFSQAKGGVGTTTICAALGEVCSMQRRRTLLWDLDIETKDLTRALTAHGDQHRVVEGWLQGTSPLTKAGFLEALLPISEHVSLLRPPASIGACLDLLTHPEALPIVQRLLHFARITHDAVIIDAGTRLGPAVALLMRESDRVVVVLDDSVLGLTAAHEYLKSLLPILDGDRVLQLLGSGVARPMTQIASMLAEQGLGLGDHVWSLAPIPFDGGADAWPGVGKTLHSVGRKAVRQALEADAAALALLGPSTDGPSPRARAAVHEGESTPDGFSGLAAKLKSASAVAVAWR